MNKFFGIAALLGLGFFWLTERPARATEPRRLVASWERESDRGKIMANGDPHNPDHFTAASRSYPLGTTLRVSANGKTVIVVITDVGPAKKYLSTRQIDLSKRAFEALAPLKLGLIQVAVEILCFTKKRDYENTKNTWYRVRRLVGVGFHHAETVQNYLLVMGVGAGTALGAASHSACYGGRFSCRRRVDMAR